MKRHGLGLLARQALYGRDMLVGDGGDRRDAGACRLAFDMHRTGAALRHAAAELGAVQADDLADRPEQRHVGVGIEGGGLAVERKRNRHQKAPIGLRFNRVNAGLCSDHPAVGAQDLALIQEPSGPTRKARAAAMSSGVPSRSSRFILAMRLISSGRAPLQLAYVAVLAPDGPPWRSPRRTTPPISARPATNADGGVRFATDSLVEQRDLPPMIKQKKRGGNPA